MTKDKPIVFTSEYVCPYIMGKRPDYVQKQVVKAATSLKVIGNEGSTFFKSRSATYKLWRKKYRLIMNTLYEMIQQLNEEGTEWEQLDLPYTNAAYCFNKKSWPTCDSSGIVNHLKEEHNEN